MGFTRRVRAQPVQTADPVLLRPLLDVGTLEALARVSPHRVAEVLKGILQPDDLSVHARRARTCARRPRATRPKPLRDDLARFSER